MKTLLLLRGLPGSGKSTLAGLLTDNVCESDSYFMVWTDEKTGQKHRHYYDGVYEFDVTKLAEAHNDCKNLCEDLMKCDQELIVVSNTFTSESELKPYFELAKEYDYNVFSLIVENRHGNKNIHGAPNEIIDEMLDILMLNLKFR